MSERTSDPAAETRLEFERALVAEYATIEQLATELDHQSFRPAPRHAPPRSRSTAGRAPLPSRR
jgi:hypothetical protein